MNQPTNIEKVYDEHSVRLYNMSLRIVGDRFEAEEVMHDTLIQYHSTEDKDGIRDLRKWLSSICIRKSIDKLRERQRWKVLLESYEDPILEEGNEDISDYDVENIRKTLYDLPDHYRAVLSLHLFEGYDYSEISEITGTNENTIRSLYMRGRQKLAEAIRQKKS